MQFGDGADERDSQEMYEACRENGINFFDIAFQLIAGSNLKFTDYLSRNSVENASPK